MLCVGFSYYLNEVYLGHAWFDSNHLGWLTVLQFFMLTCLMFLAWWSAPKAETFKDIRFLLVTALLVRVILIPIDSFTSNDVNRYMFDGKIALSGLDPYRVNHNDPALKELKQQWSPPEEHAKYPTLYPPLALALFTVVATAGPEHAPMVWKLTVTAFGIMTVIIIALILKSLGQLRQLSLVAFSPLLILETGVGVHIDVVSALLVSVALYAFHFQKLLWAGFFIGLGALTKILPIMLLLPLFFGLKKVACKFQIGIAAIMTIIAAYAMSLFSGFIPFGSIATLFEKWRFGSPVFNTLAALFDGTMLFYTITGILIVACLMLVYTSCKLQKTISVTSPLLLWSMAIILILSPVVFPWYLMALVPLLALSPRPFFLVWISLLPLTYEVLGGFVSAGQWTPATWPLIVIAIGFMGSIYFELRTKLRF